MSRDWTIQEEQDFLMQFFNYEHLQTESLRRTSKKFHELVHWINDQLPTNPQSLAAINSLLQAKDCAVRAVVVLLKKTKE